MFAQNRKSSHKVADHLRSAAGLFSYAILCLRFGAPREAAKALFDLLSPPEVAAQQAHRARRSQPPPAGGPPHLPGPRRAPGDAHFARPARGGRGGAGARGRAAAVRARWNGLERPWNGWGQKDPPPSDETAGFQGDTGWDISLPLDVPNPGDDALTAPRKLVQVKLEAGAFALRIQGRSLGLAGAQAVSLIARSAPPRAAPAHELSRRAGARGPVGAPEHPRLSRARPISGHDGRPWAGLTGISARTDGCAAISVDPAAVARVIRLLTTRPGR